MSISAKYALAFSAMFLLASCATVIQTAYLSGPFNCETTEVRPSWLSNVASTICWDKDGKPVGMVGGQATTQANLIVRAAEGAAVIGAAGIVANQLKQGTDVKIILPH